MSGYSASAAVGVMRESFETWGIELDDDALAAAVAARLVELGWRAPGGKGGLNVPLRSFAAGRGSWEWRAGGWDDLRRRWRRSPRTPVQLAAAWRKHVGPSRTARIIVPDLERARG